VGVVLGVLLVVVLARELPEASFFLGKSKRGKEIARRKKITDALKREQTRLYFRAARKLTN
jgi:hypothetical protein